MSLLIALLILGLISFQINKIVTVGFSDYDDAYIASVAKNLSMGHGYSTSFHSIKNFDSEISTGPTIIIPTALFIGIFGNKYWVPGLASSFIIMIMLFIVLWMPSGIGLNSIKLRSYCLLILLFFICYLFRNNEHLWFSLYGEVPSALFAVTATMLIFSSDSPSAWRSLFAGIIAGAAFLTKTITAFNIIALLMVLPVWLFLINRDSLSWKKARLYMVIFVAGIVILPATFEAYKKASLSAQDYQEMRVDAKRHLYTSGSGIAQMQAAPSLWDYIKKNVHRNNAILVNYTGGLFFYGMIIAIIMLVIAGSLGKSPLHFISYALLLSFLAHVIWWECLSSMGWIRHLYPGLIFLTVSLSILITQVKKQTLLLIITCLCVIIFIPKWNALKTIIPTNWQKEEKITSLLKTADFIKNNPNYSYVGAGWWMSRDLEYILPGVNNFKDYLRLTVSEAKEMKNIALVRNVRFWSGQRNPYLAELTEACQNVLFHANPFIVSIIGDPGCYRVDSASEATNDMWVNGVARSWDTAFFVFDSFHARRELTVGKKITFADGTTRTIVRTREDIRPLIEDSTLVIFLDGPPLDGMVVGYPKKFIVHHDS